jgi:hypothetical protein
MSQAKLGPPGGARSSWQDGILGGIATLAIVVGWPSAVVLSIAHSWSPVFSSDVTSDVVRAIFIVFAGFTALVVAVMGFGPWVAGETRMSGRSLVVLFALTLGPTIVLALFFYGQV